MNDPILPDNDIDVQLARKLGMLLEEKSPLNAEIDNDPLADVLGRLKTSYQSDKLETYPDDQVSAQMWQAIYKATVPQQKTETTNPDAGARIFFFNPSVYRVAIAASLLVAIAISWMLFTRTPSAMLVAEAGQQVLTHTLADGSKISLRPHSKLYLLDQNDTEEVYELEGEGFFEVTHNESRSFSVVAGDAQVSVLGTVFNVNNWQAVTHVFLQEGSIELKNIRSDQAVVLSPGQSGTVDKEQVTLHGQPADVEEHLDWLENEIAFIEAPLQDVASELEFHFNIAIEIPQTRANETISGSIELVNASFVLESLSVILQGGTFVQTGEHSYRFEAN